MRGVRPTFGLPFLVCTGAGGFAQDAGPPQDDASLRDYVKQLESRVTELEKERDKPLDALAPQSGSALESAVKSIKLSGYVETIYSWNLRHGGAVAGRPGDTLGFNQLRAGDEDENGFSFRNLALVAAKDLTTNGSTGFKVELNYGRAAQVENADPNFDAGRTLAVPEANFSWRAPFAPTDHVDFTVGRFRTCFGFETFENDQNWLVTRNPIAVFGTPITHTGIRAVAPVADKVEAMAALVNGWDEVRDANDGKTVLAHFQFGPYDDFLSSTFQLCGSYGAVEGTGAHQGEKRGFVEFEWSGNLAEKTEFGLDAVRGHMPGRAWHGAALYLRQHATDKLAVSGRLGRYVDDAIAPGGARVGDASIAATYEIAANTQVALEYRHDFSRDDVFLSSGGSPTREQDTLTASFLHRF